jgi:hypothetical protein
MLIRWWHTFLYWKIKDEGIICCLITNLLELVISIFRIKLCTNTIAPTIFNYKNALQNFDHKEWLQNHIKCYCSHSPFNCNPSGHVITGDLNIIHHDNLEKIVSHGYIYTIYVLVHSLILKILMEHVKSLHDATICWWHTFLYWKIKDEGIICCLITNLLELV